MMEHEPRHKLWTLARNKASAKLVGVAVSLAILWFLYRKLDLRAILEVLSTSSPMWVLISVGMIIPITLANAFRFRWASTCDRSLSYFDSVAATVIAIAMNLFLPAKLGDLTKSHYLCKTHQVRTGVAVSVIVFERLCDALAVASWCLLAWISGFGGEKLDSFVAPAAGLWCLSALFLFSGSLAARGLTWLQSFRFFSGREKLQSLAQGWPDLHRELGSQVKWIVLFSLGLWFLHLTQIWMFTLAVKASVPFAAGIALSPIVLLCSLVPLTLGGIGPRDAATIYLFAAYMAPEPAAAVGLLTISRSLLPSLTAIPFLRRYLRAIFPEPSATQRASR